MELSRFEKVSIKEKDGEEKLTTNIPSLGPPREEVQK